MKPCVTEGKQQKFMWEGGGGGEGGSANGEYEEIQMGVKDMDVIRSVEYGALGYNLLEADFQVT